VNPVDDDDLEQQGPEPHEATIRDLARLRPAVPSAALRRRIAAELATTTPEDSRRRDSPPRRRGLGWVAERVLWAAGGAIAATLPLVLKVPPSQAVPAGFAVKDPVPADSGTAPGIEPRLMVNDRVEDPTDPARVPRGPESSGPDIGALAGVQPEPDGAARGSEPSQSIGPISEESLAWSDDGVQFIDGQIPAHVFRHLVLERYPSSDGEGLVRPREDVFVVPVALR